MFIWGTIISYIPTFAECRTALFQHFYENMMSYTEVVHRDITQDITLE
jgi:hypothetical protein